MDWFLYDKNLRHERVRAKDRCLSEANLELKVNKFLSSLFRHDIRITRTYGTTFCTYFAWVLSYFLNRFKL